MSAAEVFGSLALQHHHRGAEGPERHRGADRGGRGWELHPVRVHERLSDLQQLGHPQAGPEAHQDGGERELKMVSAPQFLSSWCEPTIQPLLLFLTPQVYLAAGVVYGLEGALGELEQCARSISSGTTDTQLTFLEDQVATAAAQVQQSELQVSNKTAFILLILLH